MSFTVVQSAPTVQVQSLTGPLTAALPNPTGTGNTLVACITTSGSTGNPAVSSITLGGSADHWQAAVTDPGGLFAAIIWYDPACASGQTSVTLTCSGGSGLNGNIYLAVFEVAGSLASDQGSHGDATTGATVWSSGATPTTTQPPEIYFGVAMGSTSIPTVTGVGAWTTQSTGAGQFDQIAGYQQAATAGTGTFSGTMSSGGYAAAVATFYVPVVNATSAATVTAGVTSAAAVTDPRDGVSQARATVTSVSAVSDG